MLLPLPSPAGGTKNKDHELREEQFAAKRNSNEIRKLSVTSIILITEYKEKNYYNDEKTTLLLCPNNWEYWMVSFANFLDQKEPLPSGEVSLSPPPEIYVRWYRMCPSLAFSQLLKNINPILARTRKLGKNGQSL